MAGKGIRQAQMGRQLRPIGRRAQNPHLYRLTFSRIGGNALTFDRRFKPAHQLHHILREAIHVGLQGPAQSAGGQLVRTRRAAKAQINTVRIERRQGAELFGDDQRGMVGQHNAPCPNPNGLGGRCDRPDHHRGRCTGDAGHVVVLGQPVAGVAQSIGMGGQIDRVPQGLPHVGTIGDRSEIENGKCGHALDMVTKVANAIGHHHGPRRNLHRGEGSRAFCRPMEGL